MGVSLSKINKIINRQDLQLIQKQNKQRAKNTATSCYVHKFNVIIRGEYGYNVKSYTSNSIIFVTNIDTQEVLGTKKFSL